MIAADRFALNDDGTEAWWVLVPGEVVPLGMATNMPGGIPFNIDVQRTCPLGDYDCAVCATQTPWRYRVVIGRVAPIVASFMLSDPDEFCVEIVHGAIGHRGQVWHRIGEGHWTMQGDDFELPPAAEPGMPAVLLKVENT